MVGDPKQSIYRFRRADIQLYGFVRERFGEFGEVLSLSTNFRSRPPIGDVVNDVFDDDAFLPREATPEQAAFERLDTRPPVVDVPCEGVFAYFLSPEQENKPSAAADDGARIASWIRARVDGGERVPADFLVLTRGRGQLAAYAHALEAYGLPVQVTGAGVGVEEEIHELKVILQCMIDPTDPVKVLAALVGLFFGIDYERLVQHKLNDGVFDAIAPGERGHPEVVRALRRLHGWWRAGSVEPADVFIGRLVSELGVLPLATSGDLGALRAGALLYGLDAVRAAALAGDTSLPGALGALDAALDLNEAEAPLEPGRQDAVRLMNLHQAKGLEGRVVILADPTEHTRRKPDSHLTRSEEGEPLGFLRVSEFSGRFRGTRDLARPLGWADQEDAEARFDAAEEVRLLYVAVTRAMEELVVARWPEGRGSSAWSPLDAWLDEHATVLDLDPNPPVARVELEAAPEQVRAALDEAARTLAAAGRPTYRHTTVTALVKEPTARRFAATAPPYGSGPDRSEMRGFSWGSVVHGALALATSTTDGEILRSGCRDLLVEHQRPLDERGEPVELPELLELVRVVRGSDIWSRAQAAEKRLVEAPFSVPNLDVPLEPSVPVRAEPPTASGRRQLDLFGGAGPGDASSLPDKAEAESPAEPEARADSEPGGTDETAVPTVLEGVIDLAFRESKGWVIVDYKTDVGADADFEARAEGYRRQVDLYARAWSRLTGERVIERALYYTAQGRIESW